MDNKFALIDRTEWPSKPAGAQDYLCCLKYLLSGGGEYFYHFWLSDKHDVLHFQREDNASFNGVIDPGDLGDPKHPDTEARIILIGVLSHHGRIGMAQHMTCALEE